MADVDPIDLPALVEHLEVTGVFAEADKSHRAQLEADDEWTRQQYTSIGSLTAYFAHAVIISDSYYRGYKLPPGFDSVVNYMSDRLARHFAVEGTALDYIVKLSPLEFNDLLDEFGREHPQYREWNTYGGSGIKSRYSELPTEREFIDLDALTRNAAVLLRGQFRADNQFDLKFYADYKGEHPEWFDKNGQLYPPGTRG